MTPMLILLFGIKPSAAISSDLVAAVGDAPDRRPECTCVQGRSTCAWCGGSCSARFRRRSSGAYLLQLLGDSKSAQHHIEGRTRHGAADRRPARWPSDSCSTAAVVKGRSAFVTDVAPPPRCCWLGWASSAGSSSG